MKKFNEDDLEFLVSAIEESDEIDIKLPVGRIKAEHEVMKDLGLDSLGKVTLFYELADRLESDDEDEEEVNNWKKVSDILYFIHENR